MSRVLAYILAIAALTVQVGLGALPIGDARVCIPLAMPAVSCCCEGDDDEAPVPDAARACPCNKGCERCFCVPTTDTRATLTARIKAGFGDDRLFAAMLFGVPAPAPNFAPLLAAKTPRATESPPNLGSVLTTRLNL